MSVTAAKTTSAGYDPGRHLLLHDVERPQLAAGADRSALGVARVALLERLAVQPVLEVLLGAPARVHEEHVAVVGRPQQLERLEAGHLRHFAGAVREPLDELVGPFGAER